MLLEVSLGVAAKRVQWVNARKNCEPWFSILDNLDLDGK